MKILYIAKGKINDLIYYLYMKIAFDKMHMIKFYGL